MIQSRREAHAESAHRRMLMTQSGAVVGCFFKPNVPGSSRAIILEPNGSAFTFIDHRGTESRHMTRYAPSKIIPMLKVSLYFRNMHVEKPYFVRELMNEADIVPCPPELRYKKSRDVCACVRWPLTALPPLCVHDERTGTVTVRSIEGFARLELSPTRQRVRLEIILPLNAPDASNAPAFEAVKLRQLYSPQNIPTRYRHAMKLAMSVAKRVSDSEGMHERTLLAIAASPSTRSSKYMRTFLPTPDVVYRDVEGDYDNDACRPRWDTACENPTLATYALSLAAKTASQQQKDTSRVENEKRTNTPTHTHIASTKGGDHRSLVEVDDDVSCGDAYAGSAYRDHMPPVSVKVEVTPQATYEVYPAPSTDFADENARYSSATDRLVVGITIHKDGSCAVLTDDFVRHVRPLLREKDDRSPGGPYCSTHVYHVAALPTLNVNAVEFGPIVLRAKQLRDASIRMLSSSCTRLSANAEDALSRVPPRGSADASFQRQRIATVDALPTTCVVPGTGRFCRFADGRIRVTYDDRTIVQIDARHLSATIVWTSGRSQSVALSPLVLTDRTRFVVAPALRFMHWSAQSPSVRERNMNIFLRREHTVRRALERSKLQSERNTDLVGGESDGRRPLAVALRSTCSQDDVVTSVLQRSRRQAKSVGSFLKSLSRCSAPKPT